MKRLIAIWFSVVLVWVQFASAPAQASPVCVKSSMGNCAGCCARMVCCAAKSTSHSQPPPTVPAQRNGHSQVSLMVPVIVALISSSPAVNPFSSVSLSPRMAINTPLYARHCVLLL